MVAVNNTPSTLQIWLTAARPHTLTASLCPCIVAAAATRPPWQCLLLWTTFCLTVQLGTNLHNDYSDYVQGADTSSRIGHARATAQGWLTPFQTCAAACAALTVTAASGVLLAFQTQQQDNPVVWFWMGTSIFNAFAYTAGPFPLGYIGLGNWSIAYAGLGDIFVLIYFGYVAVLMLPYLLANNTITAVDWTSQWIYGTQVGLLATNIIVVNNLRDRHTDVQAHKRITSVRFGRGFSLGETVWCLVVSYALVVVDAVRAARAVRLLPLLSVPAAISEAVAVFCKDGAALNPHVGGAAKVQLLFSVLLSLGLWWSV